MVVFIVSRLFTTLMTAYTLFMFISIIPVEYQYTQQTGRSNCLSELISRRFQVEAIPLVVLQVSLYWISYLKQV